MNTHILYIRVHVWNSNKQAHNHTLELIMGTGGAEGDSVRGQGLSLVQMKARGETLEELSNTVGHLAWQGDQCLFDWVRDRKRESLAAVEG